MTDDFNRFREDVLANSDLQRELRETRTKEDFLNLVIQRGHERGYAFSVSDIEAALNEARRTWLERWIA